MYRFFLKPPESARHPRAWAGLVWTGRVFAALVLFLLVADFNLFWLFGRSPHFGMISNPELPLASEVYSADSVLLGRYYLEDRSPVTYEEIPPALVHALLAAEDIRFYRHKGVEWRTPLVIARSLVTGETRGGSTLTQQLAKNLFKTRYGSSRGLLGLIPGVRAVIYKGKEWVTAVKLEMWYSKNEILTLYLNTVNFGSNAYGLKIASRTFFSVHPRQLRVEQAALLAGLLKAPTRYSPVLHPAAALERRNVVLGQMAHYGFLSRRQADVLCRRPLQLDYQAGSPGDGPAPYFRNAIAPQLRQWCRDNDCNLYTSGLRIETTIDSRIQLHAEEVTARWMKSLQRTFDGHWQGRDPWSDRRNREITGYLDTLAWRSGAWREFEVKLGPDTAAIGKAMKTPRRMQVFTWRGPADTLLSPLDSIRYVARQLHAGLVALDPASGAVRAWVGGIDPKFFQYDHVVQSRRQPGSTFKPFVYCTALELGWAPCDELTDRPVTIRYTENDSPRQWSPHNSDWTFTGRPMSLRRAMGASVNTVTAQLTEKVTPAAVVATAGRMGIQSPLSEVPSIGLGPDPVTLLELVTAYCPFVNGGVRVKPLLITRISDQEGRELAVFAPETTRVLAPDIAFLMSYMLRGSVEEPGGTSQNLWSWDLFRNGNQLGGKTGTSSSHADGWFVGTSPALVAGAWVGSEDPRVHFRSSDVGEGSKTALPLVGMLLERIYRDQAIGIKAAPFPKPAVPIAVKYHCPTGPQLLPDTGWDGKPVLDDSLQSLMEANGDSAPFPAAR